MMAPYNKLKLLAKAEIFLKLGVSFAALDAEAFAINDDDAALKLGQVRQRLFQQLRGQDAA